MTPVLSRRDLLLQGSGAAAAAAFALPLSRANAAPDEWHFVHLTDTHIQPELDADKGVTKAFAAIRALKEKPTFALVGGDLVMDANKVPRARAERVYDLWMEAAASLKLPLHYSLGNHDPYGLNEIPATEAAKKLQDPNFGKGFWKRRLGLSRTYDTFDFRGWRFVTLDSVSFAPDGAWEGVLDDEQLHWLDNLLRKTDKQMPMVFLTHFPVFTIFKQYTEASTAPAASTWVIKNGKVFEEMTRPYNVRAVFQGHTHVVEECRYLNTRYITGGAVCGDWWKGKRLGVHPEGFSLVTVRGDDLSWRYIPYGWNAVEHQNDNA